ncbi:hypothetical protein [Priestia flexa]|uniref:hypothetical protein n=1 Tax=Priestia flexa TaxID=86664 RepID=UPI001B32EF07|nr:hypothetical protein [Priestia flexa]
MVRKSLSATATKKILTKKITSTMTKELVTKRSIATIEKKNALIKKAANATVNGASNLNRLNSV